MGSLYDRDLLAWSEQQAAELSRLSTRPDLSNAIDWANVIEEILSLGRSDLRAFESNLVQFLAHLIKTVSEPSARAAGHWRKEAFGFLAAARSIYAASMRQRVDVDRLWRLAVDHARAGLVPEGCRALRSLPPACPLALDVLIDDTFSIDDAINTVDRNLVPLTSNEATRQ